MAWLSDPEIWAALITLATLEIVLGIDNLIFISVLVDRLPPPRQALARQVGLLLALVMRLLLLASVLWLAKLATPIFDAFGRGFSWRDLILIGGGLYLVYSGTREIHTHIEGGEASEASSAPPRGFGAAVAQIAMLDVVFSLDSVITAVGMARQIWVMVAAIMIAIAVMLLIAGPIARFINRHSTIKVLAFAFLLLIGTTLVADGFGFHVPRGYIYAAIGFSIAVEALNQLAARRRRTARAVTSGPSPPQTGRLSS